MPRNTLSWIRCELCGRRSATIKCRIGGRVFELCPYCALAVSKLPITECTELKLILPTVNIYESYSLHKTKGSKVHEKTLITSISKISSAETTLDSDIYHRRGKKSMSESRKSSSKKRRYYRKRR